LLAASDRGLNYSLQQVTKEALYVPLTDVERYKAKVFIDVLVDRAAKALSSVALLLIIATMGFDLRACLAVALAALGVWALCSNALGQAHSAQSSNVRVSGEMEPMQVLTARQTCEPAAERLPLPSTLSR
jgi:ATP/ADP translocase